MRQVVFSAVAAAFLLVATSPAQPPATTVRPGGAPRTIDFVRDVQPIFEAHCVECHGPDKQMNGFRLDRRRDAMRGGTAHVIAAGSAAASRLYLRLVGETYGRRMPLDADPLAAPQISTIQRWLDEGAEWPDAASGDVPVAAVDPAAMSAFAKLRAGDRAGFVDAVRGAPGLATRRGPGGATPLMAAALYGDAALVTVVLDAGGKPNDANDAGVTPLMWAVSDLEKARVLVGAGADVMARSLDGRTPILAAAGIRGNRDVVALLLDHGANPSSAGSNAVTPLVEAARRGDAPTVRLLLERGADPGRSGAAALAFATRAGCDECAAAIGARLTPPQMTQALVLGAGPQAGTLTGSAALLERGASAGARNPLGFPVIVLAASFEEAALPAVAALITHGADVNATGPAGETALTVARRSGFTPLIDALSRAGAKDPFPTTPVPAPAPVASAREAVRRSLPALQHADVAFLRTAGCVSCHHNSQTAETVALARTRGLPVDERVATAQRQKIAAYLDDWRERVLIGQGIPGEVDSITPILNGLAAERHPPDAATDAMARFVRLQQAPAGNWRVTGHRPPIESGDVRVTAESIRSMRAYTPPVERALAEGAIRRAAGWLATVQPDETQERAFQVLGLHWARADRALVNAAATRLISGQRPDGGWAQCPSLGSDAYATGESLVALLASGTLAASDPVVRRGVEFLRRTQLADGSWFVARRAIPIQPYFDAGFPHGRDQFISAAATNWATQALLYAMKTGS
ncbi:MAG: ankyrin repeat domain-containing protein [Vicinamibacterales bacterium]